MTVTTYTSSSKGTLKINEMVTEHLQNVVNKMGQRTDLSAQEQETLTALKAELATRDTSTTA